MPTEIDVKEILRQNTNIDQAELARLQEALERLRKAGLRPRGYRLAPPSGGRRVAIHSDEHKTGRPVKSKRR